MIDLKRLRSSPDEVRAALARRGDASVMALLDELRGLDERRRMLSGQLDALKSDRNKFALEDAAANGDAQFVDAYGPSRGHDACARDGSAWINGKDQDVFAAAAYHPLKAGMAGVAAIVLKALR